jgi:hypothetical protein
MRTHTLLLLTFAFAALTCWNGCTTSRVIEKSRVPEIVVDEYGKITLNKKQVELGHIGSAVKSAGFLRSQEVNILIPDNPDRKLMGEITAELVRNGYTRTIFVKNRKATAAVPKQK